ncbi:hypothetical protein [Neisseria sp. Ec49-e6-T10]|uniref:hypothetical protein n=1 Tax=Neisseria sp. Ec49-e6-T10 TaxID=3140744 RepID=UPI003EBFB61E
MFSSNLRFKSNLFPVIPGEDEKVNPKRYGKKLTEWLAKELSTKGFTIIDVFSEDFGRVIWVKDDDYRLYVCCGNEDEEIDIWVVFVSVEGGRFFNRLFGKDTRKEKMEKLLSAVRSCLQSENGITELTEEK